jgi:hypothetical protein
VEIVVPSSSSSIDEMRSPIGAALQLERVEVLPGNLKDAFMREPEAGPPVTSLPALSLTLSKSEGQRAIGCPSYEKGSN